MPVFLRPDRNIFPPLSAASEEGLLAIGGDLSRERLLSAYVRGIFPWYDKTTPILWWALPERCMLRPREIHIPKSLRRVVNSRRFSVTFDIAFANVIRQCAASSRPDQAGTWIVPEIVAAYIDLHEAGYAHSVEAWQSGELVGGLYGVSLGRAFFGESIFFKAPEASKVCFVWLARVLEFWKFTLIDCQQVTDNLLQFSAYAVNREIFNGYLVEALLAETVMGKWHAPSGFFPL
jgi:leucyl/phenylalanyl-tRNA--protein transferase